jgi:nucleotide-binding universal stress UspA family protein
VDGLTDEAKPTLLVCYDGSEHADHAVEVAGRLFPGANARILHIWEPVESLVARYAVLSPYLGEDVAHTDDTIAKQSRATAERGAKLASGLGLAATAHSENASSTIWEAVIAASQALHADVVITGTRSLRGVREVLASALSHALLQRSEVPVLAIPYRADA